MEDIRAKVNKISELKHKCKPMAEKIYFGDAIIRNTRTAQSSVIRDVVYTEHSRPSDERTRATILQGIRPTQRPNYQVTKLCFESAKQIGETIK